MPLRRPLHDPKGRAHAARPQHSVTGRLQLRRSERIGAEQRGVSEKHTPTRGDAFACKSAIGITFHYEATFSPSSRVETCVGCLASRVCAHEVRRVMYNNPGDIATYQQAALNELLHDPQRDATATKRGLEQRNVSGRTREGMRFARTCAYGYWKDDPIRDDRGVCSSSSSKMI
jgi:hypothetical protein